MYNQYLKLLPNKIGHGLFTSIDIPANMPITEIIGDLYSKNKAPDHPATTQISHDLYIGPTGNKIDKIKHSCNPNCYLHIVGSRAILFSLHFIRADSELTFDYSTTDTSAPHEWSMECKCGTYNCRKIISGFHSLDESIKEDYKKRGLIPLFLSTSLLMQK